MKQLEVVVVLGVLVLIRTFGGVKSHTIGYYDCYDIRQLMTYSVGQTCEPDNGLEDNKKQVYTLLQLRSISYMTGVRCQVTRSTVTEYCGSFSHNKLAEPPEIEVNHPVKPIDCLEMWNTAEFVTPMGERHGIEIGAENIIHTYDLGTISVNNNQVTCQGQSKRFQNGKIVTDILQVSQFKVIITPERYLISEDRVETKSDHVRLPNTCQVNTGGCRTHEATFVWSPPRNACPWEEVRRMEMLKENGYLVDTEHKILLKKGLPITPPQGCPTVEVFATGYANLFITKEPNDGWNKLKGDVDITDYIRAGDDYLAYQLEKKMIEKRRTPSLDKVCQVVGSGGQDEIIQLEGNDEEGVFIRRNGDAMEHFHCPRKIAKLAENLTICYDDIPLANGMFVKVHNRQLTQHSAPRTCNEHFATKVKTAEEYWVQLPSLRLIKAPPVLPTEDEEFIHEDLSQGGIYTKSELQSWKDHLELGDVHDSVAKTISYGVCVGEGSCPPSAGISSFNLDLVTVTEEIAETMDVWRSLGDVVTSCGAYLALAVLLIESVRLANFIAAVSVTMAMDGVEGAKAIIYMIFCGAHHEGYLIRRRHSRLKKHFGNATKDLSVEFCNTTREGTEL